MNDIEVGRFALRTFRLGWNSVEDRPRLLALSRPVAWENGVCEAACVSASGVFSWGGDLIATLQGVAALPGHAAPQGDCTCGIYGTLDLATLMRQYHHVARHLIAVIAAEGTTIIGPKGLRTARARVVAYWTPHHVQSALPEAKHYRQLPKMLTEYHLPIGELSYANANRLGLPAGIGDTE